MSYTRAVRNQQKTVKTSTKSSAAGAIAAPQLKAPFMCHLLAAASSAADDKEFPIGLELNMEDWRPRFLGIKCHFQDLPLPGRRQRLVLLIIELFE
ncbi:hypothetical protein A1O7_06119 [Cladophialophora yegresii CBS 114405]|uniref:Uncharacterized protein n=1 Tax=Cladophialophora yegresii CBS 114405 TaxID=1182544 RepID=W9W137_9EURO|nr:uncharacterized protein A1O7_06119 [Cladophialophora yegresii CBS 114405]EXJ58690.1 hypothetical protein A1O7_06119 [Cladophialophora yegresii CBS 114405]